VFDNANNPWHVTQLGVDRTQVALVDFQVSTGDGITFLQQVIQFRALYIDVESHVLFGDTGDRNLDRRAAAFEHIDGEQVTGFDMQ